MRITGSDWLPDGINVSEAVTFAAALKALGADYVCVSSGGVSLARIPVTPGYQVNFAAEVRSKVGIPTRAVGMIADPQQADAIIESGQADMVALGRAFLDDPRWVWHAAEELGKDDTMIYPPAYERSRPSLWAGARLARPHQSKQTANAR